MSGDEDDSGNVTLTGDMSPISSTVTVHVPGPGVTFNESATCDEKLPAKLRLPFTGVVTGWPQTVTGPLDPLGGFHVIEYVPL